MALICICLYQGIARLEVQWIQECDVTFINWRCFLLYCNNESSHKWKQQQQQQPFYGPLSGTTTWAGTRRNIHPPIIQSLSASSIYHESMIHSILIVQITCLAIFLHNLFPCHTNKKRSKNPNSDIALAYTEISLLSQLQSPGTIYLSVEPSIFHHTKPLLTSLHSRLFASTRNLNQFRYQAV